MVEEPAAQDALARALVDRVVAVCGRMLAAKVRVVAAAPEVAVVPATAMVPRRGAVPTAAGGCANVSCGEVEVTIGTRGVKFGAGKKVVAKHRSRVCPELLHAAADAALEAGKWADDAGSTQYRALKTAFRSAVDGGWTSKPAQPPSAVPPQSNP